jgi:hypothetical protein
LRISFDRNGIEYKTISYSLVVQFLHTPSISNRRFQLAKMDFDNPKKSTSDSQRGVKIVPGPITSSIDTVPVTVERKPYQPGTDKPRLAHAGSHPHISIEDFSVAYVV